MTMPGFTADSAVYRSRRQYGAVPRIVAAAGIVPLTVKCGRCTCQSCCTLDVTGFCKCCDDSAAPENTTAQPEFLTG